MGSRILQEPALSSSSNQGRSKSGSPGESSGGSSSNLTGRPRNDPAYLIFMRHGPAVEPFEWRGSDRDRPLTDDGITRTKAVCSKLVELHRPTLILSSEYLRARQTADLLLAAASGATGQEQATAAAPVELMIIPELNQNRPWGDWREAWSEVRESLTPESIVVAVGHGPSVNEILCWHSGIDFNVGLKKAGFAALKSGHKLSAWISPKWLVPEVCMPEVYK